MARCLHGIFVVVFLLSFLICQLNSSTPIELKIEIDEELPVGSEVADLAAEAGLEDDGDALQFDVISSSFYRYFSVIEDKTSGSKRHLLVIDRTMDREVICSRRSAKSIIIIFVYTYYATAGRVWHWSCGMGDFLQVAKL